MRIIFLLLILTSSCRLFAQGPDTAQTVTIEMKNSEEFTGKIIRQSGDTIVISSVNGEMSLLAMKIKSITPLTYKGEFTYENPNSTRYFFSPTAIPLKKGKGYYQNLLLTMNFVNVGVTDNISIGGGLEFVSLVLGTPIWFLTPKAGFRVKENLHLGVGVFVAGLANEGSVGIGYGVATVGSSDHNFSVGLGYGFSNKEVANYPVVTISASTRVSNNISLLSENYIIPLQNETFYFGIHGLRVMTKKSAFDFGLFLAPLSGTGILPLPFVGYVRGF